jgi:hypothetical protein
VEKLGGHKYDGNLAGVKAGVAGMASENAGSKRGQNGGMAGVSRGEESPVSMRLPVPFYEDALEITIRDEAEENHVVAVQPRVNGSMSGAGHAGVTRWPA